jgi:hypothetical protein
MQAGSNGFTQKPIPTTEPIPPVHLGSGVFGEDTNVVCGFWLHDRAYFLIPFNVFKGWRRMTLRRNALPYSLNVLRMQKFHKNGLKKGERMGRFICIIRFFFP